MAYESDFVDETLIDFEIEGRKFKFKPITAGEELEWAPEYIDEVETEEGMKRVPNFKKLTMCQLRCVKEVPYDKEQIKKMLGVDKEYSQLTKDQLNDFWGKLKPSVADMIIRKVKELSNENSEIKKNLPLE